jgi:hypothetical protein
MIGLDPLTTGPGLTLTIWLITADGSKFDRFTVTK